MLSSPRVTRRHVLALTAVGYLPVQAQVPAPRFTLQTETTLRHAHAILHAALELTGYAATLERALPTTEMRSLQQMADGQLHVSLMPITPQRLEMVRQGRLRMIPIPLERGLLGWRASVVVQGQEDKLSHVRTVRDLQSFVVGQGQDWVDVEIYRGAGITTRELPAWRNGEFVQALDSGAIDLFPLGLEELHNVFMPHFRQHHPRLRLDTHLLLRYPWYRCVCVTAHPVADALFAALQTGLDTLARNGGFVRLWEQHRQLPSPAWWRNRSLVELRNPFYGEELIPGRYQHLLFKHRPGH